MLKGVIAAAVAIEDEAWMLRALKFLPGELERQFHPDGGHVERSSAIQLLALQDLIEIRNLLNGCGIASTPQLSTTLERAGVALRLFRHGDGGLALFNATRDETSAMIDVVLTQGQNVLSGQQATVDLNTGAANITGRVRTVLQPGGN